jgi:hypothetical protein
VVLKKDQKRTAGKCEIEIEKKTVRKHIKNKKRSCNSINIALEAL